MKYYFKTADSEVCLPKEAILCDMKHDGIPELEVYEAVREIGGEFMWCKLYAQAGEKGNCGRQCKGYEPKNGKSGCCKHYGNTYSCGDKVFLKTI